MVISVEKSDRANRLGIGRMTTDQILDDTILLITFLSLATFCTFSVKPLRGK